MRKKTQCIISLVIVVSLLLLAGCSQNENTDSGKSGEKYTVRFFVTGIEESAEDVNARSVTENESPVVFTKTLDDGYTLTGTLEKERVNDIHTRAAVANNIWYRIVAYKEGGDVLKDSKQGLFQVGSATPATLILPPGTYQLYAYSCNSIEAGSVASLSGDNLKFTRIPYEDHPNRELLVSKIPNKVIVAEDGTTTNSHVSIAFLRKTSKLTVQLDGVLSQSTVKSGNVKITPQKYGVFDYSLGGGGGAWNANSSVSGNKGELALADFPSALNYKTSSGVYVIPRALSSSTKLSVKLANINIGISTMKDATLDITKYEFKSGYKYTMKIKVTPPSFDPWIEINGVKWARTNTKFAIGPRAVFFDYPFEYKNMDLGFQSYRGFMTGDVDESGEVFIPSVNSDVSWSEHRSNTCPSIKTGAAVDYKLPTKQEFTTSLLASNVRCHWGTYDGVSGMFFTDNQNLPAEPAAGTEHLYLFLPAGGRQLRHVNTDQSNPYIEIGTVGSYWSSNGHRNLGSSIQPSPEPEDRNALSAWQAYCFTVQSSGASLPFKHCALTKYCTIRCVVGTQQ